MKTIKNPFLTLLAASALLFSCKKDEDPQPQPAPQPPVITNEIVLKNIEKVTILEDRFADPNLPDYFVNENIEVHAALTIKPGVVIAFAEDVSMIVHDHGAMFAKGDTARNKQIRFIGKLPQSGYWGGLEFYSKNSGNELHHAEVLHAGSIEKTDHLKTGVTVHGLGRLTLRNTHISKSGGYGLYLRDGAILVNFANNVFSNNAEAPVRLMAENVAKLDAPTVFSSSNGRNAIEIMTSSITGTGEVIWPAFNDNTPYFFAGQISVQTGWKLLPGVTIEVAPNEDFEIGDGYINAIGSPTRKIVITGAQKTFASWKGIRLYTNNSKNVMENVEINYAGSNPMLATIKAAISVAGVAKLNIRNSTITNCGGYGIHVYGSTAVLNTDAATVNTFTNNSLSSIFYDI